MSAWLRNRPATRTDNSNTTMLRTIANAITNHLRKRNELATPTLKRHSPSAHRTDCGTRSGVTPRWRNVWMRMRHGSGESTDGAPVTDQRSTMAATATRWLLPAVDREIAWTVLGEIRPPLGHVYGYALAPVNDGTLVTSYYDWSSIDSVWREAGIFPVLSEGALRATLGILARTVTQDHKAD